VQNLALFVFPDFEDHRIQPATHPADGQKLFRNVGSPTQPIGLANNSRASSKPMPRRGFALSRLLFRESKEKRILI
jgi:hypothetical protein